MYGIGQAALTLDTDYTITAAETTTPPGATSAIRVGNYNLVITGMGNYSGVVPVTWSITPRAITPTLTLAETAVTYTGAALTKHSVTVTAGSMADGEQFSCNFTGSQTDVGFSENSFTVQNGTAKLANYDITCQFGTLTVTVPTTVDDAVKDLTVDTVTVNDRQAVQQTLNSVNAYLNMQPNQSETMRLEALRDDLLALLA